MPSGTNTLNSPQFMSLILEFEFWRDSTLGLSFRLQGIYVSPSSKAKNVPTGPGYLALEKMHRNAILKSNKISPNFQLHGSNSTHVLLYRLELESEGLYSCEVSTFPSFITAIAFKQMKVICELFLDAYRTFSRLRTFEFCDDFKVQTQWNFGSLNFVANVSRRCLIFNESRLIYYLPVEQLFPTRNCG